MLSGTSVDVNAPKKASDDLSKWSVKDKGRVLKGGSPLGEITVCLIFLYFNTHSNEAAIGTHVPNVHIR